MKVTSLNSRQYQAKDIKHIFSDSDIDKNKLFYWIRTYQLLKPDIEEASGTGTRSKFSAKNILELAIIQRLISFGVDLTTIKDMKSYIDDYVVIEKGTENIEVKSIKRDKVRGKKTLSIYSYAFIGKIPVGVQFIVGGERTFVPLGWIERPPKYGNFDPVSVININISGIAREVKKKLKSM